MIVKCSYFDPEVCDQELAYHFFLTAKLPNQR